MSYPMRRCLNCDYLLDARPTPVRCPECGHVNDFAAADRAAATALSSPFKSALTGAILRRSIRASFWRVSATGRRIPRSLIATTAIFGLLLPLAAMGISAAVALKTTIRVSPAPLYGTIETEPYLEYHWYGWRGWSRYVDRSGEAHFAFPFGHDMGRVVLDRDLVLSPLWRMPGVRAQDLERASAVVAGWWLIWLIWWLLLTRFNSARDPLLAEIDAAGRKSAIRFSLLIMNAVGLAVLVGVTVDLAIRCRVPQYGTGIGVQWHAFRDWLPWTLLLPALLLWMFSASAPPTVSRLLRRPVGLLLGPALAWTVLRLTRVARHLRPAMRPTGPMAPACQAPPGYR